MFNGKKKKPQLDDPIKRSRNENVALDSKIEMLGCVIMVAWDLFFFCERDLNYLDWAGSRNPTLQKIFFRGVQILCKDPKVLYLRLCHSWIVTRVGFISHPLLISTILSKVTKFWWLIGGDDIITWSLETSSFCFCLSQCHSKAALWEAKVTSHTTCSHFFLPALWNGNRDTILGFPWKNQWNNSLENIVQ